MTAGAFELRPGTVPYRAVAYLQTLPPGAEVKGAMLAEAIGTTPASMNTCMEAARNAGLVFGRKRDAHRTSPVWWSLVDHTKAQPKQEIREGQGSQHVVKATAARPDATDRETRATASPRVGAMGAGQPADAGPAGGATGKDCLPVAAGGMRIALWSAGTLQIERAGAAPLVLSRPETRALVQYLDSIALDGACGNGGAP